MADLRAGQVRTLSNVGGGLWRPVIKGDAIIWGDSWGLVYGLKLPNGAPVVLARDSSPGAIAGDFVAWLGRDGLQVARLSDLFAHPPTALPTPVPTEIGGVDTPTP